MQLELDGVRKHYGGVAAVADVSLSIAGGEFFALLGPSGCGKTTLLRIVAGIIAPDAGRVRLDGNDITDAPLHGRDITLVFQSYALFPHRTVFENIAFGLVMRRVGKAEIREKVERVLGLVRLSGLGDRYPGQISGGQQQRVALARALVVSPKVLLLDEPLSNLDARLRDEMRDELQEIQRQVGITTVLVTHDIHEAFALSDRIAVLNRGRLEQIGSPAEIYRAPRTRFVAQFAGQVNVFDGRLESIDAGRATVVTDGGHRLTGTMDAQRIGHGAAVSLIVRPEAVRLAQAADGASGLPAVVRRATYLGNAVRVHLDAGGLRMIADLPGGRQHAIAESRKVVVQWHPDEAVILPAESNAP